MNLLLRLIFIIGVCLATVGSAGFHDPFKSGHAADKGGLYETWAPALFSAGLGVIVVGTLVRRSVRQQVAIAGTERIAAARDSILALLSCVRDKVADLGDSAVRLDREELCTRVDHLLNQEYFDLVEKREDLIQLAGFNDFARIWDGVAAAERLLARVWSMATDGYLREAVQELPRALSNLDRALAATRQVWPTT